MNIKQLIQAVMNPDDCEELSTDEILSMNIDLRTPGQDDLQVLSVRYDKDLVNEHAAIGAIVINIDSKRGIYV